MRSRKTEGALTAVLIIENPTYLEATLGRKFPLCGNPPDNTASTWQLASSSSVTEIDQGPTLFRTSVNKLEFVPQNPHKPAQARMSSSHPSPFSTISASTNSVRKTLDPNVVSFDWPTQVTAVRAGHGLHLLYVPHAEWTKRSGPESWRTCTKCLAKCIAPTAGWEKDRLLLHARKRYQPQSFLDTTTNRSRGKGYLCGRLFAINSLQTLCSLPYQSNHIFNTLTLNPFRTEWQLCLVLTAASPAQVKQLSECKSSCQHLHWKRLCTTSDKQWSALQWAE